MIYCQMKHFFKVLVVLGGQSQNVDDLWDYLQNR